MRFRLYPSAGQESGLLVHCAHARYVWNLAVEQQSHFRRGGRVSAPPSHLQRCRQLTEARAASYWLAAGSQTVQQQALRDFDQAMTNFFNGTHRRPTWRSARRREGFRIVAVKPGHVRQINRRWSAVLVPKIGWVKLRRTRQIPAAKSYRITRDRAGRWHVAFTVKPEPIAAAGNGQVAGVDRGVATAVMVSDGSSYHYTRYDLDAAVLRAQRKMARCQRGSNRRAKARQRLARATARRAAARKDFVEKATTDLARRFDTIVIEDLRVANMTRSGKGTIEQPGVNVAAKAGLNRAILDKAWGQIAKRLEDKAVDRVIRVNPAFTSQRCSSCGHVDRASRESQTRYRCTACNTQLNADLNAAINIAAGHAVTARRGPTLVEPVKREPQLV